MLLLCSLIVNGWMRMFYATLVLYAVKIGIMILRSVKKFNFSREPLFPEVNVSRHDGRAVSRGSGCLPFIKVTTLVGCLKILKF